MIPPRERAAWRPWVRLVVADLQQALARPAARRDEAWLRSLFLIPYRAPLTREVLRSGYPGIAPRLS